MEQVIEVARRAVLAAVWIGGVALAVLLGISGFTGGGNLMLAAAVIAAFVTWAAAKLANWIFGK